MQIVKEILITGIVLVVLLGIVCACLFVTDYIMVKDNKPTLFTRTHTEETQNGKIVYEDGIFYHVVTNENQVRTLYLFNNEINVK